MGRHIILKQFYNCNCTSKNYGNEVKKSNKIITEYNVTMDDKNRIIKFKFYEIYDILFYEEVYDFN
jgi:hypothetical protein